ncbi:exosortase-associated EpsI family protein [bacterium]|nr:exosortase-associated EpsI family protein [bacterium]
MTVKAVGPVLVGVLLTGGVGVVHGVYTDRWGPSGQLQEAVAVMDRLPPTIGDWSGEDQPIDPEELGRAGIRRCVYRRYTNPRTREALSALVVCGRGGPISVHTPDVCFAGNGFRQEAGAEVREARIGSATHTFNVARFKKPGGVSQGRLEIWWAWSKDGQTWVAPNNPRTSLARASSLYKFYAIREFLPGSRAEAADTITAFLTQAIPAFGQALDTPN